MDSSMPNLNLDSTLTLKIIFGGHFALTTLALLGNWLHDAYVFYNAFFLAFLLWSQLATDADFPLTNAVATNIFAILADIIIMAVNYPGSSSTQTPNMCVLSSQGVQKFGLAMAILNLLARLASSFLLYRIREQRRSLSYGTVGEPRSGLPGYEDLPSGFSGDHRADIHNTADTKPLAP